MTIENALYLIPVNISDAPLRDVLPDGNRDIVCRLRHFIVENTRTARRFLRRLDPEFPIDGTTFCELNEHTDPREVSAMLEPLRQGVPVGVMSEAGCPAVADPGARAVEVAQREGMKVIPLIGPSSILLALMASGFNGQGFCFNGYLPIDQASRTKSVRELETLADRRGMTQIFIEAPYRNNKMLRFLTDTLRPDTMLCVASDLTDTENQSILSMPVSRWKKATYNYDKHPAIFLIFRGLPPS